MTSPFACDDLGIRRRDLLRVGASGLFGLTLPELLRLEAKGSSARAGHERKAQARAVILVWLNGGPATIDMWDMKPDAPDAVRGEFRPSSTRAAGMQICEHLPRMCQLMDRCTLVRSLAHTIPQHGLATTFVTTGNRPSVVLRYPTLGALLARLAPSERDVPSFVAFREKRFGPRVGLAGYLGPAYDPFELEVSLVRPDPPEVRVDTRGITLPVGFSVAQLDNRDGLRQCFDRAFDAAERNSDLLDGLDTFQRQALELLRSSRTRDALDVGREAASVRARYGQTTFGQACLAARRLVEAGARFVTVGSDENWDTHSQNFGALRTTLLPTLDHTLSALIEDLDSRGLLDSTIVYCAGEFGRTPIINNDGGRDHWARSMAVLLAGGGFKRGSVYGSTDVRGMSPESHPCTPDDIAATVCQQLGIDPHQELQTPTGRPVQLFREGRVKTELVA